MRTFAANLLKVGMVCPDGYMNTKQFADGKEISECSIPDCWQ